MNQLSLSSSTHPTLAQVSVGLSASSNPMLESTFLFPHVSHQFAPIRTSALRLQHDRRDAAHMLGISLRTLDRLIAAKQIGVRKIGRRVLIPAEAIRQFMKRDHLTEVTQ